MAKEFSRGKFSFPREAHLKRSVDISAVFKKGNRVSYQGAKLFFLKNGRDDNRVAFAFGRKFGKAVQRNRSRRLSREAYRLLKSSLVSGFDLVFLVYPPDGLGLSGRLDQFRVLFLKAGLKR